MDEKKANVSNIDLVETQGIDGPGVSISKKDLDMVSAVSVEAKVLIGTAKITVGNLFGLQSGEVLELDTEVDEAVHLLVNDKIVASGQLVCVDGNYGLKITELS